MCVYLNAVCFEDGHLLPFPCSAQCRLYFSEELDGNMFLLIAVLGKRTVAGGGGGVEIVLAWETWTFCVSK